MASSTSLRSTLAEISAIGISHSLAKLLSYKALEISLGVAPQPQHGGSRVGASLQGHGSILQRTGQSASKEIASGDVVRFVHDQGAPALANRLRAAIRQRNGCAHPNVRLETDATAFTESGAGLDPVRSQKIRSTRLATAGGCDEGAWAGPGRAEARSTTTPLLSHLHGGQKCCGTVAPCARECSRSRAANRSEGHGRTEAIRRVLNEITQMRRSSARPVKEARTSGPS